MLQNLGIGRWISIILLAMVVIAVWKANNGDISNIISSIWQLINNGAEIILGLWDRFIGSGEAGEILNDYTPPSYD